VGFSVAGVAHFHHQLRASADRDDAFVRELAARAALPFVGGTTDVRALAAARRWSLEDGARRARYEFLEDAARRVGADRIATGHTRDDQVETVLLKLARGAGAAGLGGISPRRGRRIRPLLDTGRAALREYLAERGERWVEDETNADLANPRNRVRHLLVPQLRAVLGAHVDAAIARAATAAREDATWLDLQAAEGLAALVDRTPAGVQLPAAELRVMPPPVVRRILLRVMREAGRREVSQRHVDGALDVLAGRSRAVEVPGGRWELKSGKMVLLDGAAPIDTGAGAASGADARFRYVLEVPGHVVVPEAGCAITAVRVSPGETVEPEARTGRGDLALVSQVKVERFLVRRRQPGDRMTLPGRTARRKLQDVFVDAKVPRAMRDRLPVVTGEGDRVVWVPGHGISADFRVNPGEDGVILLKFTRLGGKA
jgi:tRNA(Ile)-lysidine synthase